MKRTDLTETEQQYVAAYINVCHAVWDCTKFVTNALDAQVTALAEQIADEARIEQLKEIAYREACS